MPSKIITQAITFDDVLLEPRLQRGRARRGRRRHAAHAAHSASTSRSCSARRWTPSPKATWPSRWPKRAGSASSTRTCRSSSRPRRSTRSSVQANGIIVDPVTSAAQRYRGQGPRSHGPAQRLRRADHDSHDRQELLGIITRRDLRFLENSDLPICRGHDPREPGDGTGDRNA